jgi:hypothetical protein
MHRRKAAWAMVAILSAPAGAALVRLHLIAPTPWTFVALGVLAALCVGGILWGFREARRVVRAGLPIRN